LIEDMLPLAPTRRAKVRTLITQAKQSNFGYIEIM